MLRKIFGHSFLYTIANHLPLIANIVILPIITPFLTKFDYGIYGLTYAYLGGFSAFSLLGIHVLLQNSFFKKKKVVPHVRLTGIIGSGGRFKQGMELANQRDILKKAFSVKKISHVAISINSPGGSPVQSHLIYSYIRQLAEKNKIKVIVFAEDVAASGGYFIACAGDEIYANSSSIIGSIGVISASFGFKELIQKIGVERRVYTAGKNKSTLDPFKEEKEEDIKRLKNIQLELHEDFIKVVEKSRGSKLKDN